MDPSEPPLALPALALAGSVEEALFKKIVTHPALGNHCTEVGRTPASEQHTQVSPPPCALVPSLNGAPIDSHPLLPRR